MSRLDALVESLESGDVALADLLAKYEEGSRLASTCENQLKSAELRIDQLKRGGGTEPFALGDEADPKR